MDGPRKTRDSKGSGRTRRPRFPITARTSDGLTYHIRPIRADDACREAEFIRGLSTQSRYQRFMHHLRDAGDSLIAKLVDVDHHRTMALVAVSGKGDEERIIATAQYAADDDDTCEFAIVVADSWQCRGVGTTLAPVLFDYAASEGFQTIYGTILADNARMVELAEWIGLTVDPPRAGERTVRAWRRLLPPTRSRKELAGLATVGAWVDPGALLLLAAANGTPVLMARIFGRRLNTPIDALFGRDSAQPLFGSHKTWRGLVAGTLACTLVGALLPCGAWVGLGFAALALGGDLASSFVKRRMHWHSGRAAPLLDQLPESLLPLMIFARPLGLGDSAVFGTALVFTLLDLVSTRWRERLTAPSQAH